MSDLTNAIMLAAEMHDGQIDKGGNPYILHPLRLMLKAEDEQTRIVAVLHDIAEDTEVTLDKLREKGFSDEVVAAVDCLTRRQEETYDEFIKRIKPNRLATTVKILDIEDNKDISRISAPTLKDYERLDKYDKALSELRG